MATSAAKRRRIDEANHTLSKPFRSPFKTPHTSASKPSSPSVNTSTPLKGTISSPDTASSFTVTSIDVEPPVTPSTASTTPRSASLSTKKAYVSPATTAALNADVDIAHLVRTQRELEKQLREVKEFLETAEQAKKIETESRATGLNGEVDGELVILIDKWKGASRQAAEELFGKVRDRVNRMGGPRAWKEAQKKQQEFQNSWDQAEERTGQDGGDDEKDDDDDDEDGDARKKDAQRPSHYEEYAQDIETENERSQRPTSFGDTGELPGQEDEFTMAMMLRTLNVELAIIGYDRHQERWVD